MSDSARSLTAFIASGHRVTVDELELFSISRNFASGSSSPVTLFLHGIPTWSWMWRNVIESASPTCQSIAVDLPGFGLSSSPSNPFGVSDLARTVLRWLDCLAGKDREINLVVHDFGALVGAEMIRQSPARFPRLVVTNTSYRAEAWTGGGALSILSVPFLGQLSMHLARPWMLRMAMSAFVSDQSALEGERFAGYWYPFEIGFGQSLARMYQSQLVTQDDFQAWRSVLSDFRGRSLILWGARDPVFTLLDLEETRVLLPESEVVVFENANHFLPEDRPQAMGRNIRSFLHSS